MPTRVFYAGSTVVAGQSTWFGGKWQHKTTAWYGGRWLSGFGASRGKVVYLATCHEEATVQKDFSQPRPNLSVRPPAFKQRPLRFKTGVFRIAIFAIGKNRLCAECYSTDGQRCALGAG